MTYSATTWQAKSGAAAGAQSSQLGDFLAVIRKRRTMIVSIALAVMALTLLVLLTLPILYSASSVVVLEGRKNSVADQSAVLSSLPTDPASVQNQIQVLTSRGLASRVIDKLQLWRDPEFNGALAPSILDVISGALWRTGEAEREHDAIITAFLQRLSVDSQGLSTAFTITFSSQNPEKAARIANAIADAYIASQLDAKADAAKSATQWLLDRIQELSDQAQAAEAAVEKYKADNNLSEGAGGTPIADQELAAVSTQLSQARSDLAQKQATYDRVTALVKSGHGADISQVVTSPLIVQLRTQQADLIRQEAQLAARYGPLHPKMIDIESQKHNLEDKIAQEVTRIVGTVANDVAIARAQVTALESNLKQSEGQASGQNMTRVKLKALQVNAASTRSMYESFVTRLRETQNQDALQVPDAHVISRALVPVAPSSPQRTLIFFASIPAGLLFGLFIALLVERFGPALRTRAVQLFRGLPVLAQIPNSAVARAADQVADQPLSGFAQAVDGLVAQIASPVMGQGGRVVAITSAQPGESKTAIAVGIARAAAKRGLRTIILDGNLQWPEVARTLGFAAVPSGVFEVLMGAAPLSRSLFKDPRSTALTLSTTRRTASPSQVLASNGMAQLVAHLRRSCDLVIIDSPPVLGASEMRFVAPLADAVMMVVRWDGATRPAVDHAIGALAAMRSPPVGIVIAA